MASDTKTKIRYGLILQRVLARALTRAGVEYEETPQYEEYSETPDFLIPNAETPEFILEVHQTDARDHFRMKTLRSFVAVAEAKAHFGTGTISVNVLFGDPHTEVPAANLRAMCGFFDCNVLLQRDAVDKRQALRDLEETAYELAQDHTVSTADAATQTVAAHQRTVNQIGKILAGALEDAAPKDTLRPMWEAERTRLNKLGKVPLLGQQTFYKKHMIRSLFFSDEDFLMMRQQKNAELWPVAARAQSVATGVGRISEDLDGDHLIIDPEFALFLCDPDAVRLRALCKAVLDAIPSMHWFFEDIRTKERRQAMVEIFLNYARNGRLTRLLRKTLNSPSTVEGIKHTRVWVVDVATRALNISQNRLSRLIFTRLNNVANLGDPISHMAPNTARFRGLRPEVQEAYVQDVVAGIEIIRKELGVIWEELDGEVVQRRLLELRMTGAMRLRKLDALFLIVQSVCVSLGLEISHVGINSVLSDLAKELDVSRFEMFQVQRLGDNENIVVLNSIAAEGNPKDKAKEWGARRRATLYRLHDGQCILMSSSISIFIIDGMWNPGDVVRLHRSGWTHIIRMGELEPLLRHLFNIERLKPLPAPEIASRIAIEENH